MKFLIRFCRLLRKFIPKPKTNSTDLIVPWKITSDEIIVRGIVRPLLLSKGKLTHNAFLPPKANGRNDVSVLRHDFTNTNHCKEHIKNNVNIPGNEYCGFAVLKAKNIEEINNTSTDFTFDNGEILTVSIKSTPLPNLDMHSDILYSHGIIADEPNTIFRKMAKSLINKSKYLQDPNPTEKNWNGKKIDQNLFLE